jgi:putative ABC transport system permease protein
MSNDIVVPPKSAKSLLRRLSGFQESYSFLGDLEEDFTERATNQGLFRAQCWYWKQVFISTPSIIKHYLVYFLSHLSNLFKIAKRQFLKNKFLSFIHVFSLSLGFFGCFVLLLYIEHEWSYDKFHKNYGSIYRAIFEQQDGRKKLIGPPALASYLKDNYIEISHTSRYFVSGATIKTNVKTVNDLILMPDAEFLEIFTFPTLLGDPKRALIDSGYVAITEKMAANLFGKEDPLNQDISLFIRGKKFQFKVAGVLKDIPPNSSIQFRLITNNNVMKSVHINRAGKTHDYFDGWNINNTQTFILLSNGQVKHNIETETSQYFNKKELFISSIHFDPFEKVHLERDLNYSSSVFIITNPIYLYFASVIGLFLIMVSVFNFTNLSIGQSFYRFKEIGIKKTNGASRKILFFQAISETLSFCSISLVIGILITLLFLPIINELFNTNIPLGNFFTSTHIVFCLFFLLSITFLIGFYPAIYLSSFQIIDFLTTKFNLPKFNIVKYVTSTIQYLVLVFLLLMSFLLVFQVRYMTKTNLGFDPENVINISTNMYQAKLYKDKIKSHPNILGATHSNHSFDDIYRIHNPLDTEELKLDGVKEFVYQPFIIDENYFEVLGIEIIEGRNLNPNIPDDTSNSFLVNESFVNSYPGIEKLYSKFPFLIYERNEKIGVIKDFNFLSKHKKIIPSVFKLDTMTDEVFVKVMPDKITETLKFLEETWINMNPEPFQYALLTDLIEESYSKERQWNKILVYSSIFSIFISGFGIFGLCFMNSVRRRKEMGIRKVYGANFRRILFHFNKEFLITILLANLIAWPVAWYVGEVFLDQFAYRINYPWYIFIIGLLISFLLVLFVTSYVAVKTMLENVTDVLRYE